MSKSIMVRYKGLEILCKPDTVSKYRDGIITDKSKVVMTDDTIFKNVKKGNVASEKDITKALGDKMSINDVLELMLQKGDYQMTTKERQELNKKRKAQLVSYFHENFLDPKTDKPIPESRIESTLDQIKATINYEIPFNKSAEDIRKNILGVLPIKPNPQAQINTPQPTEKPNKYKNKGKSR